LCGVGTNWGHVFDVDKVVFGEYSRSDPERRWEKIEGVIIMKCTFALALVLSAVLCSAPLAWAETASQKNTGYTVIKGGVYSPSESYDLNNFNGGSTSNVDSKTGYVGELAFGHYFFPIFGIEMGAGYFESKGSPAAEPGIVKLKVVPVLASAKVFLPLGPIEPYGEVGIGAYFTKLEVSGNLGSFSGSSKVTYGVHAGAGLNINLSDAFFLGAEGRYIQAKPEFGGQPVKLNGYTATIDLGFRY
jgi:opacity protein-like surface antigen